MLKDSIDLMGGINAGLVDAYREISSGLQEMAARLDERGTALKDVIDTGKLLSGVAENLEQAVQNTELQYGIDDKSIVILERVKDLLEQLAVLPDISGMIPERHENILSGKISVTPEIEAIWSNNSAGNFLFSSPPAGLADASSREWWRQAMAGDVYTSSPYISAITRKPCITVSVPIKSHGQVVGVVGADVGLEDS